MLVVSVSHALGLSVTPRDRVAAAFGSVGLLTTKLSSAPIGALAGGVLAALVASASMLLFGERFAISSVVRSVLGLNGNRFAPFFTLAGFVLASLAAAWLKWAPAMTAARTQPHALAGLILGVAATLSPCPWGSSSRLNHYAPALLSAAVAVAVAALGRTLPPPGVRSVAHFLGAAWSRAEALGDFHYLHAASSAPLWLLLALGVAYRLLAKPAAARAAGGLPRRRTPYGPESALSLAAAAALGAVSALGVLLADISRGAELPAVNLAAYIASAFVTSKALDWLMLRYAAAARPWLRGDAPTLDAALADPDSREHGVKLYAGAALSGLAFALGGVLVGPTIISAAAGGPALGTLAGVAVGSFIGAAVRSA